MEENNQDMFKMMEKAMELKKILDDSPQDTPQANNDFDFAKMLQFVDLIKTLNSEKKKEAEEYPVSESEALEPKGNVFFDDEIITPQLKSVKAVIPFLDYEKQKLVAFAVKIIELKKVVDYYEKTNIKSAITAQSLNNSTEVFSAVKPYLDSEKKYIIEMIEKVFELKDIMDKYMAVNKTVSDNPYPL